MQEIQDFYKILEIEFEASEKEIRKSFRQKSLQYHPDRAGNNEKSAEMFHLISLALETLTDPVKKKAHDDNIRAEHLRQARLKEMNKEQRNFREELEKREHDFQTKKTKAEGESANSVDKLREETRLKMMARKQMKKQSHVKKSQTIEILKHAKIDEASILDCTVKVQWSKKVLMDEIRLKNSLSRYGDIEGVILNKSGKRRANVIFKAVEGAFNAIYGEKSADLEGFNISYAGDTEPQSFQFFKLKNNQDFESEAPLYTNQVNRNQEYEELTLSKLKKMKKPHLPQ